MRFSEVEAGFKKVFRHPSYLLIALAVSCVFILLALWVAGFRLISFVLENGLFPPMLKARVVAEVLWGSFAAFRPIELAIIFMSALLLGINTAMTAFYLRSRVALQRSAGASVVASVLGILGVGCASCGSVALSALFGTAAAAGALRALPFGGLEFGLIGLAIMAGAVWVTARKVAHPEVCPVGKRH